MGILGLNAELYPGPTPLGLDDHVRLISRESETADLVARTGRYHIIELTARSGVGKTSFVKAGLAVALRSSGVHVPEYDTWAQALGKLKQAETPENVEGQAEMLYRIWIGAQPADPRELPEILAEQASARWTVVVLDQLEEILRYRPALAAELLRLAGSVAVARNYPHVLVARTEYREELSPAEVPGAAVWASRLTEIEDDESLAKMITMPASGRAVFDADAVGRLIGQWRDARVGDTARAGAGANVGLIHFQTLIWAFAAWAGEADRPVERVTGALVDDYVAACHKERKDRGDADTRTEGAVVILESLLRYVKAKASGLVSVPPVRDANGNARELKWRNGPRLMLARVAPALSAGGYKQPQSLYSLVGRGLADELTPSVAMRLGHELQEGVADVRVILESAQYGRHAVGIAARWPDGEEALADGSNRLILQEMIDSLHAALLWMANANVLRAFKQDDPIFELVHDGMGVALEAWARGFLDGPEAAVGVLGPQTGKVIAVNLDRETLGKQSDDELAIWGGRRAGDHVSFSALAWPASLVRPDEGALPLEFDGVRFERGTFDSVFFENCKFHDVRFEGCSFRGAFFADCEFHDVRFTDCDLRATGMKGCAFHDVTFERGDLGLLTFIAPKAGSEATFVKVECTGLFFQAIPDSAWTFTGSRLSHVVIEGAVGAPHFLFAAGSVGRAVSVSGADGVVPEVSDDSDVQMVDI